MKRLLQCVVLLLSLFCAQTPIMAKDDTQTWAQTVADAELFFPGPGVAITGSAIGVAATPGDFFVFSKHLLQLGKSDDFEALLKSPNMALRALGVVGFVRLNQKTDRTLVQQALQDIFADKTKISVTSSGCMGDNMTFGEWAQAFFQDPNFLGHDHPSGASSPYDAYFLGNAFYSRANGMWNQKEYLKARDYAEAGLRQLEFVSLSSQHVKDDWGLKLAAARKRIEDGAIAEGSKNLVTLLRERLDLFLKNSKP